MYDMAIAIAREFDAPLDLVKEGKGAELKLPAKRPLNTALNISKLKKFGIGTRSFNEGIKFVCKNM